MNAPPDITTALTPADRAAWNKCTPPPAYVGELTRPTHNGGVAFCWSVFAGHLPGNGLVVFLGRAHPLRPGQFLTVKLDGAAATACMRQIATIDSETNPTTKGTP